MEMGNITSVDIGPLLVLLILSAIIICVSVVRINNAEEDIEDTMEEIHKCKRQLNDRERYLKNLPDNWHGC